MSTEASDDRITESKRTKYTDATKRANVNGLNKTALNYLKNDADKIKARIASKEVEEERLLRELRGVRGEIEAEKRKLERGE